MMQLDPYQKICTVGEKLRKILYFTNSRMINIAVLKISNYTIDQNKLYDIV